MKRLRGDETRVSIYGHTVWEASTVIIDIHDERPTPEERGRGEWERNGRRKGDERGEMERKKENENVKGGGLLLDLKRITVIPIR